MKYTIEEYAALVVRLADEGDPGERLSIYRRLLNFEGVWVSAAAADPLMEVDFAGIERVMVALDVAARAIDEVRTVYEKLPMISALKETIARRTGDAQWRAVRPPLTELSEAQRATLPEEKTPRDREA